MVSTFERSITGGGEIRLRARFLDDLGEGATASGVLLHIWDPDNAVNFDNLSGAYQTNISPTYVGNGIYQYDFTLPIDATEGTWKDGWTGLLNQQELEEDFTFTVYAGGSVENLGNQIFNNNVVEIILASGLRAADGAYLGEETTIEFLTTCTPAYSNVRKVRLSAGGFLGNVYDDAIQTAIHEASIEADTITFNTDDQETSVFYHARREYVTCSASSMLMQNLANNTLRSKTLADLSVEYDTNALQRSIERTLDCMDKWAGQVIAGGNAISSSMPKGVVKGSSDPDRIEVGRMWYSTPSDQVSRRSPSGNVRFRDSGSRRYKKTTLKRYW